MPKCQICRAGRTGARQRRRSNSEEHAFDRRSLLNPFWNRASTAVRLPTPKLRAGLTQLSWANASVRLRGLSSVPPVLPRLDSQRLL